jgi:hypothetical protein
VLTLPGDGEGRLVVREGDGTPLAAAPVLPLRPAGGSADALGLPEVRVAGGLAEVRVRLGLLRREGARLRSARVGGVRLSLLPDAGGAPLPVAGAEQDGSWPAGAYRFIVARRLATGLEVPAGRYRLRVTATGPDGAVLRRASAPFRLA